MEKYNVKTTVNVSKDWKTLFNIEFHDYLTETELNELLNKLTQRIKVYQDSKEERLNF